MVVRQINTSLIVTVVLPSNIKGVKYLYYLLTLFPLDGYGQFIKRRYREKVSRTNQYLPVNCFHQFQMETVMGRYLSIITAATGRAILKGKG